MVVSPSSPWRDRLAGSRAGIDCTEDTLARERARSKIRLVAQPTRISPPHEAARGGIVAYDGPPPTAMEPARWRTPREGAAGITRLCGTRFRAPTRKQSGWRN